MVVALLALLVACGWSKSQLTGANAVQVELSETLGRKIEINMAERSRTWVTGSQRSKSAVAKPVVVMMETTWKAAVRTAVDGSMDDLASISRKTVMAAVKLAKRI